MTSSERSKVNLDLWDLLIAIVSFGLTYIVTLASTVFQKINFSKKKSNLNALESKFDFDVKKVNVNLGSSFEMRKYFWDIHS